LKRVPATLPWKNPRLAEDGRPHLRGGSTISCRTCTARVVLMAVETSNFRNGRRRYSSTPLGWRSGAVIRSTSNIARRLDVRPLDCTTRSAAPRVWVTWRSSRQNTGVGHYNCIRSRTSECRDFAAPRGNRPKDPLPTPSATACLPAICPNRAAIGPDQTLCRLPVPDNRRPHGIYERGAARFTESGSGTGSVGWLRDRTRRHRATGHPPLARRDLCALRAG